LIFNLYSKVIIKAGDESYEFDRSSLMYQEVVQIEEASGLSFGEWQTELGRYSLKAVGALIHILRIRAGVPSDFAKMDFPVDGFDVIPLHGDGSEFTAEEVAADITRRLAEAQEPVPTGAADPAANPPPVTTASTSRTSVSATTSALSNGTSSRGATSRSSKRQPTRT
jgi:hypothetical protein